jgi:hypothetical protein
MVEPADHRDGTDPAEVSRLELAMFGSVLRQGEMCARSVVVVEVLGEYPTRSGSTRWRHRRSHELHPRCVPLLDRIMVSTLWAPVKDLEKLLKTETLEGP